MSDNGFSIEPDGTIVVTGRDAIEIYSLISWRSAMGLELRSGMMATRNVNCKTIIPALVARGITDVQAPYSRKRKIQAYKDLDKYIEDHGGQSRPLL